MIVAFPAPPLPHFLGNPAATQLHAQSTTPVQPMPGGTAPGTTVPACWGGQGNYHLLCLPFSIKKLGLGDPVWLVCSFVLGDGLCSQSEQSLCISVQRQLGYAREGVV